MGFDKSELSDMEQVPTICRVLQTHLISLTPPTSWEAGMLRFKDAETQVCGFPETSSCPDDL